MMSAMVADTTGLYSVSSSPVSDVSTQVQLVRAYTHYLFLCARESMCAISLGKIHFANKAILFYKLKERANGWIFLFYNFLR